MYDGMVVTMVANNWLEHDTGFHLSDCSTSVLTPRNVLLADTVGFPRSQLVRKENSSRIN